MNGRPLTVHCSGPVQAVLGLAHMHRVVHGVAIHVATLADLQPAREQYLSLLDPSEVERMQRFKFEADKERFLLGHGFLRSLLGRYLDADGSFLVFERGTYGKPFLPGSSIRFNLSDTKNAIAVAISSELDLGVDIETMTRPVDHVSVGSHYFTAEEQRSIAEATDGKRRFLEFWTRKEAVLKASGVGIMDDLRVLRVDQAENRMTITHDVFVAMAAEAYHVRTWHVDDDHIISLATAEAPTRVDLFGAR